MQHDAVTLAEALEECGFKDLAQQVITMPPGALDDIVRGFSGTKLWRMVSDLEARKRAKGTP